MRFTATEIDGVVIVDLDLMRDERGAFDDNMKLGDVRARAVKAALVESGVKDGGRIVVISMGEERPVALGHDEAAWRRNRRVEFILQ